MHSSALMCFPFPKILLHIFDSDSHDSDTSAEKRTGLCLYFSAEYQNTFNIYFYGNYMKTLHSSLLPSRLFLIVMLLRNIHWNNIHLGFLRAVQKSIIKFSARSDSRLVQTISSPAHLSFKYQKWASTWTRGGLGKINRPGGIYMKST